jgi:hypothetical protein
MKKIPNWQGGQADYTEYYPSILEHDVVPFEGDEKLPEELMVRLYQSDTDEAFVKSSWIATAKYDYDYSDPLLITTLHRQWAEKLIANCKIHLLCNASNTDQFVGYVIYQETTLGMPLIHQVLIKRPFRGLGLARQLVQSAIPGWQPTTPTIITSWGKVTRRLFNRNGYAFVVIPAQYLSQIELVGDQ